MAVQRLVFAFSLWCALMLGVAAYIVWDWLEAPQPVAQEHNVYSIPKGTALSTVAQDLSRKDLIRWPKVWVLYARLADLTRIKAGEYRLAERESPKSLLTRFQSGEVVQYQITLVEGLRFRDYLATLRNHHKLENKLSEQVGPAELSMYGINVEHPEGWFFPDTYYFSRGDSDVSILKRAYDRMQAVLQDEWANRAEGLPYDSAYEALIMASIVEKETGVAYERKKIAGVFVRRLQNNMRLQTDPTVIYGLGEDYQGDIKRRHLKQATPYNTYVIKGLPPSPIAMPGLKAINAALNPASGTELYFVAKGDGTHYFSESFTEHKNAVNKYQKNRVENYQSAPPTPSPSP